MTLANFSPRKFTLSILLLALLSSVLFAQDTSNNKFGKGLQIVGADSSFSMKFSTRFQTLYQGVLDLDSDEWSDRFLVRRARLKFDGFVYNPKITYKIELGLSNRDHAGGDIDESGNTSRIILDAVVKWQATKHWSFWFGQTKLPGNRERVISSQKLQFVDRSLLNSRLNIDRDIGVQVRHDNKVGENGILKKMFSLSMGEGRDIIAANTGGYNFTYRLEYLPFGKFESKGDYFGSDLKREEKPKLAIGLTYDVNQDAARQRGQLGSFVQDSNGNQFATDLSTIFADFMFKYDGFSMMGEYGDKKASDNVFATLTDGSTIKYVTGNALNLQAGYLFKGDKELAFRYTSVSPDDLTFSGLREEKQYTLAFSRYIVGHSLKIQSDIAYHDRTGASNRLVYRFQVEVAF
ncbi:porin [Roseivirga sp. E12]|uniref:porin n=1 Tax=Roseivirga sp. E12 TaxID=2819237 RepID=UPI001ABC7180|nr:porin [Roseivirga sp. E12]MBO3699448.1 FmdC precursor [Roseivirga sp. E12]